MLSLTDIICSKSLYGIESNLKFFHKNLIFPSVSFLITFSTQVIDCNFTYGEKTVLMARSDNIRGSVVKSKMV